MRAKIIDYDTMYNRTTGNTGNHMATDELIKRRNALQDTMGNPTDDVGLEQVYEEGFASASGVRNETAETGGRVRHPESKDAARPNSIPAELEEENSGLADS